jgi:nucleoside-diphosphate-sugar epimerase
LQKIIVSGATSQIGYFLLPRLLNNGYEVTAISRKQQHNQLNLNWIHANINSLDNIDLQSDFLLHLSLLSSAELFINKISHLNRVIAFSSTSRFTKINSKDPKERKIADTLAYAEDKFINLCEKNNITWTIFRPTLVYGCGLDRNISFIANFIYRFGFFPMLGNGQGLRQPIHADDLALACLQVLNNSKTFNNSYNLSGGETLSYYDMILEIFKALDKKPRIISIPTSLFNILVKIMVHFPYFNHISTSMLERMNQNLCFEHIAAKNDFSYKPRSFNYHDLGI